MARYRPAVKARGGRVVLETLPALVALFKCLPGVGELRVAHESVALLGDDIDLHVPLLGLPRAFGKDLNSIPAPIACLRTHKERVETWRPRLERSARRRVGIV